MNVNKRLLDAGYEDVIYFTDPDYEDAFIGVSSDDKAVYDYDKMILCLMKDGMTDEEAMEFIDFNTIRALPYIGDRAPVIMYSVD